jgi:hypothetical protein
MFVVPPCSTNEFSFVPVHPSTETQPFSKRNGFNILMNKTHNNIFKYSVTATSSNTTLGLRLTISQFKKALILSLYCQSESVVCNFSTYISDAYLA